MTRWQVIDLPIKIHATTYRDLGSSIQLLFISLLEPTVPFSLSGANFVCLWYVHTYGSQLWRPLLLGDIEKIRDATVQRQLAGTGVAASVTMAGAT